MVVSRLMIINLRYVIIIAMWQYMMYFNDSSAYGRNEPSLFSDDDQVSEATIVAQKLRKLDE